MRLLLVEDNPGDAKLLTEALKESSVPTDCSIASDGELALDFLSGKIAGAKRPDLILLDLNLPKLDGWDVLRFIKADLRLARIPVIVLTTSVEQKDVRTAYDLRASCYLSKPKDLGEFLKLVRVIEEFWLIQVRLPIREEDV